MLARFRTGLPVTSLRASKESIHTSAIVAARPTYGSGRRGQRFVPARARLAERPGLGPAKSERGIPIPSRIGNQSKHVERGNRSNEDDGPTKPKKIRPRERQLIIELPSTEASSPSRRDTAPHLSGTSSSSLQSRFTTPPLLPGLVDQIHELLGNKAKPSPIQELSLSHLFRNQGREVTAGDGTLLAAETGSGKSLAYLLPVIQALKASESSALPTTNSLAQPRALILVPTHELARQVKSTLSHLTHAPDTKLRSKSTSTGGVSLLSGPEPFQNINFDPEDIQLDAPTQVRRSPDVVVGTPASVLDLTRPGGRHSVGPMRPGRDNTVTREFERNVRMGFGAIEWVVVDEADVLFDPDFALWTETILQDIRTARNSMFNLVLTTATVSAQLDNYLNQHYPQLTRLTTPELHRLPASLQTEYVYWDRRPGNRNPTVLRKLQDTWAEETRQHPNWKERSKIIIFCNRSKKVEELGEYLKSEGIRCVSMTSDSENRQRGSNKHIEAFLKPLPGAKRRLDAKEPSSGDEPDVLITTSLLSRGLDFTPAVRSVFIVDEPRNEVDFIHRAGRAGRAGRPGRVVVFTKGSAGGSKNRAPGARKKISAFDAA